MRSDLFHRVASLLHWDGMLVWDVTLVHTLSFEWMVVGNMQNFEKKFVQRLAEHVALRLWHRQLTHSVSKD